MELSVGKGQHHGYWGIRPEKRGYDLCLGWELIPTHWSVGFRLGWGDFRLELLAVWLSISYFDRDEWNENVQVLTGGNKEEKYG